MQTYYSLNEYLRERFGGKVYKLALDGGFTCPNRDGRLGYGGCSFCAGGSGDFAALVRCDRDAGPEDYSRAVREAAEEAKKRVAAKAGPDARYIIYFQSYTATYDSPERLEKLYRAALELPEAVALSLGTRPDCLPEETVKLLAELNRSKPVWVELGLQTVYEETARRIRRGYPLPVFDDAAARLKAAGLKVVVHMILGLPGETPEMMRETAAYIRRSGADGVKLQLLHVLEGTDLAEEYRAGAFRTLELPEYIGILKDCVEALGPDTVIHRLTGDGAKKDLIAPLWSADKKRVLNAISRELRPRSGEQKGNPPALNP